MPIHKIILGGEQYLPFALSKLRDLAQLANGGYLSRKIIVDGVTILLSVAQDQHFLTIMGEEAAYEFFTTEKVFLLGNGRYGTELVTDYDGITRAVTRGSGTEWKFDNDRKRAKFSEGESIPENAFNPPWQLRDVAPVYLGQYKEDSTGSFNETRSTNVINAPNFFKTWSFVNNQKNHEYVWWPRNSSESFVTSTQGYGPGRANTGGLYYFPFSWDLSPDLAATVDQGLDVPPVYWKSSQFKTGQPVMPTDYVWPRRAAVQKVVSEEWGTREFFIMTDTHGRFYVYPAKNYFALRQTTAWRALPAASMFSEGMFKVYTPPYPAWVATQDPDENVAWSDWMFTFNKDATKAVTVALNKNMDPMYYPFSTNSLRHSFAQRLTPTSNNSLRTFVNDGSEGSYLADPDNWLHCYQETPGLVEFNIAIEITGPGEMEYEATITLGRTEYTTDNNRFFVDAAYLLKPKAIEDAETVMGAAEDTLVVAEMEVWWPPTVSRTRIGRETTAETYAKSPDYFQGFAAGAAGIEDCKIFYVVRNYDTGDILRKFCVNNGTDMVTYTGGTFDKMTRPGLNEWSTSYIQQADLRSMSFLVMSYYYANGSASQTNSMGSLYVWNTLQHTVDRYDDETTRTAMQTILNGDFPASPYVKIPDVDTENADVARVYQEYAMLYHVQSYLMLPVINVHPEGHWAFAGGDSSDLTDPNLTLDIIQAYKWDKTLDPPAWVALERTSHRSLFNEAFGQERPADYYTPTPDDDLGSFGLAGIWRIMRKDR